MPEAVIVATARSPIGRAFKGTLTSIRSDDLTAQMIAAALAKVPQLDPADLGDLMLGCGLPGGEQGYNMARVVAVMLGYDSLPGTTVTRYCSSSLQTTRMAFHAIKAGEGDAFISAGVECVSRFGKGSSDSWPDTKNPVFAGAEERARALENAGADRLLRGDCTVGRDHGPRPGRRIPAGAGPGRDDDRRHRPGGDQRGVRRPGDPVLPGPGHRPRQAERQWRGDRRRPSVRHDRGADHLDDPEQPAVPRQDLRPRDHVRRRRPGHGDDLRAPVLIPPSNATLRIGDIWGLSAARRWGSLD